MGKWITLVILAIAGAFAYWRFIYESPAYLAYVDFEEAAADGNCDKLLSMAEGQPRERIEDFCRVGGGLLSVGHAFTGTSPAAYLANLKGSPEGKKMRSTHHRQSEATADDGSVELVVDEVPVAEPLVGDKVIERHFATLKPAGEAWKIVQYRVERPQ